MAIDKLSANAFATGAIANSLGYTPANKAGDTFTGNVVFSANATITGAATFSNTVAIGSDYLTPYTGFKNRIINGDMRIAQRGTAPTMTGGGDYSLDRFGHYYSSGAVTTAQSSVAPAGFAKSLLITVSSAAASPTYNFFYQKIEGLNCTDLGFGLSTASPVTLSFWVRSSVTGIYSVSITNYDGDRAYAVQYTINAANTWEQKTITIPGDTTGTWYTTNTVGLYVRWNMGSASGSRLISAGSWQAANADGATGSTGANAWVNTSGATFYLTGVQLEKGSTATAFDWRPYGTELQLCQRYYAKLGANAGGSSSYQAYGAGGNQSTNTSQNFALVFPQYMRVAPTIAYSGNMGVTVNGSYVNITGIGGAYTGYGSTLLQTSSNAVGSAGQGAVLLSNADANAYISLTAEL